MTLRQGQASSDDVSNEHPRCEQWVFVVSGLGEAIAGRRRTWIGPGSLVLIEKGEKHQIRHVGRKPLVTINLYAPPAYSSNGAVRPKAK